MAAEKANIEDDYDGIWTGSLGCSSCWGVRRPCWKDLFQNVENTLLNTSMSLCFVFIPILAEIWSKLNSIKIHWIDWWQCNLWERNKKTLKPAGFLKWPSFWVNFTTSLTTEKQKHTQKHMSVMTNFGRKGNQAPLQYLFRKFGGVDKSCFWLMKLQAFQSSLRIITSDSQTVVLLKFTENQFV